MFTFDVLDTPLCIPIKELYLQSYQFMQKNVVFQFTESEFHTKEHCARVLLHSLVIAYHCGIRDKGLETIAKAAIFHDSRREDDSCDIGHGYRAASYYKEYCLNNGLEFDERTYFIISFHDECDIDGITAISKHIKESDSCILLYNIFKDADALDRFRLGNGALDIRMLRTVPSRQLISFAKRLVEIS